MISFAIYGLLLGFLAYYRKKTGRLSIPSRSGQPVEGKEKANGFEKEKPNEKEKEKEKENEKEKERENIYMGAKSPPTRHRRPYI
ncbi:MAG: hypothetical protein II959_03070 [Clostridia bacterium]|nr:hypothetical protein [Clostridia bacterium]